MPNKNYLRGRRFEYDLQHAYQKVGDKVYRTAGSHGEYDLIDFDYTHKVIRLIQCKTKITNKEPNGYLNIQEIEAITDGWKVYGTKVTKYIKRRSK